jgi:hypothetical protein
MISNPTNVRFAEQRDEEPLYELLLDLHKRGPSLKSFPPSPKKLIETIKAGTEQRGMIIGVIDGEDLGVIVASVGMVLMPPWWSDTAMLIQRWIYSRPGTRGLSDSLFRFSEWAREYMSEGLDRPMVLEQSHVWGDRIAARDRLFARHGRKIGSVFLSPIGDQM